MEAEEGAEAAGSDDKGRFEDRLKEPDEAEARTGGTAPFALVFFSTAGCGEALVDIERDTAGSGGVCWRLSCAPEAGAAAAGSDPSKHASHTRTLTPLLMPGSTLLLLLHE